MTRPTPNTWLHLDATQLAYEHRSGARSVVDTIAACCARSQRLQPRWNAFLALDCERALARAHTLEHAATRGRLHGVPIAVKANLAVEGLESSCASRMLVGWRAPYTATAVARLEAEGAVVIGTTNMDEYAMGSSGESSAFGPTHNPWDEARAPGGSSSGSAAAVAGHLVPLALGSDTGGSVRQPAAWCGLAGFKPTWGRISRYGLVAYASSLDCVAPLARSMRDLDLALDIMAGPDARDATCSPTALHESAPFKDLQGLVLGVPHEWRAALSDGPSRAAFEACVEAARAAGARIVELSLPLTRHAVSCYYLLATVEAASNLARFDGLRYGVRAAAHSSSLAASISSSRTQGFGAEVKRRIVLGTYALSAGHAEAWHTHAAKVRTLVCREFDEAWGACDALLGPTTPFPAIRLGERSNDPLSLYACDALTTPVSLAGLPAAALRTPLVEHEGGQLPTGAQVVTPHGADRLALRIAEVLETQLGTQALRSPAAEVQA